MDTLDIAAEKLAALNTGSLSVFDVIMQMNNTNQAESGLDLRTWLLVRLAALAATDAPPLSYQALLAVGEDEGISVEAMSGALIAAGPVIGSPRLLAAGQNLADAIIDANS